MPRKNFGAQLWLVPQLVALISAYDECRLGGTYANNQVMSCISAGHKTTKNILARQAFTVDTADEAILGTGGKPDASKIRAISLDPVHHDYLLGGEMRRQGL